MAGLESFGELLSEHMRRAGISDAEMARTLGVQRQTIFRWREGLTQHPRERQDILRMAAKLRLNAAERDELLLSAGFAPDSPLDLHPDAPLPVPSPLATDSKPPDEASNHATTEAIVSANRSGGPVQGSGQAERRWRHGWPWVAGAAVFTTALLIVTLIVTGARREDQGQTERGLPQPAAPGETLIAIGEFANYSGGQAGYNVAGRLHEALQEQIDQSGLPGVRVVRWPQVVADQAEALSASQALSATLVVWGEYDSGRVLAHVQARDPQNTLKGQELRRQVGALSELSLAINTELPQEMQWMTLYVLGEAYLRAGQKDPAENALRRALAESPGDDRALAGIYFDLASIESEKLRPDLNQVIAYGTLAIEHSPHFAAAYNNRGVAYLNRRAEGDQQRALRDFEEAVRLAPDLDVAQFNLGVALLSEGPEADERALAALQRAQATAPQAPGPNNALCWLHALRGEPEKALPFCDQAVAADLSPLSRDSRGIVYALLGRSEEAIAEFQAFLEWLRTRPQDEIDRYASKREAWIDALQRGHNPFDAKMLEALRKE